MKSHKLAGYEEYVRGIPGQQGEPGLVSILHDAWTVAASEETTRAHGGRPVSRVVLSITTETTRGARRQVFTRELDVRQDPDDLAPILVAALEADPGPSFEGKVRAYVNVAGKQSIGLGSYQRMIATGFISPEDADLGEHIVVPRAVFTGIILPLIQSVQGMATEAARSQHESANVIQASGNAMRSLGEGANAIMRQDMGGLPGIIGKVAGSFMGGGLGRGGAAQAQPAQVQVSQPQADLAERPSLFLAPPAVQLQLEGPSTASEGARVEQVQPAQAAPPAPAALTRADVERWAEQHPEEAEAMVRDALMSRGFGL